MDAEIKMTIQEAEDKGLLSQDVAEEKRKQLKQLFPEVITEDKIDFEQLRRVMGDWVEPDKERYGLNWPGKAKCMKVIQAPSIATLKPERGESVDFDDTENLFIEGDNLEVLKLLQKAYFGKIKMIYIDPPYNTGKEFIYPDKYQENLDTYLAYTSQVDDEGRKFSTNTDAGGRFHANWLNMMYPRLYLCRNLLREDGVIFISIDENEKSNLRLLTDTVFGASNLLGIVANTNNPKGRSDDKYFATAHEYLLVYAKNVEQARTYGFEPGEHIIKRYNKTDKNGKAYREIDLRKTGDADRREDRPDMFYYFYFNQQMNKLRVAKESSIELGEQEIIPLRDNGSEGRWRWGFEKAQKKLASLYAKFMPLRKIWGIFEKDYLDGRPPVKPTTSWTFKDVNSERGSEGFIELGFAKEVFPRPKPLGTMRRVLEIGTLPHDESIVLDFFAGSGSFGEACFQLNSQSKRKLKFILVQLPERINSENKEDKAAYEFCVEEGLSPTISSISLERLKRSAKKCQEETGNRDCDYGVRVFHLSRSNFSVWNGETDNINDLSQQLAMHVDHIDQASEPEDILYELLLKAGFELQTRVKKQTMAGKNVYTVAGGALLICLDKEITPELIDALVDADPLQVICLDEGFKGNDQLKTNAVQTFKSRTREGGEAIVFRTV